MLLHLVHAHQDWTADGSYLLETVHHIARPKTRLIDLAGTGADYLVMESETGWGGGTGVIMTIFDLSSGAFHELLHVYSSLADRDQEGYSQTLDIARTRQSRGAQFCFVKTLKFEHGIMFPQPKISHPCYKPARGRRRQRNSRAQRHAEAASAINDSFSPAEPFPQPIDDIQVLRP